MHVSRQPNETAKTAERGPRARTRKLMLETATRLMQSGITPSVSEVAEAAEVSRATAYRYFPSQAALVHAVVDEALGPILDWSSDSPDARTRVADLLATAMPRIDEFEATFKAALKLSLDQWAQRQAGTLGNEPLFTRGHRVDLLKSVTRPLQGTVPPEARERLAQALSLVFGVEVLIVLKDIWGLTSESAQSVAAWAAKALVEAAVREAGSEA
ncbi:TetR/AcrR family transcriptional regulator [Rhizobium mongolense]|uniref:TetR/AcrR family transcriptional regulator n=1 Tax=Rhizobium mongolense TaxID=57676 RepID=UPI001428AA0E|nr:TetR/AcrR family transcriptional regulator [Rhizobium mongolense]